MFDKQVILCTSQIMSMNGIKASEFIRQVFGYEVIYNF